MSNTGSKFHAKSIAWKTITIWGSNMSVRTKAYTINRLIWEVGALDARKVKDYATLVTNLSPRGGKNSAKIQVLNTFLGGDLKAVVDGKTFCSLKGKSIKARVVSALKYRKEFGYFS